MAGPAASAYPHPIIPPSGRIQIMDKDGYPTSSFLQMLTQMWQQVNGANPMVPCTVSGGPNNIILTPFVVSPTVIAGAGATPAYYDYATWSFVATATSTGAVTAGIQGLATNLKVYKALTNSTQAGANDIFNGMQYFLTFADALNGGAGGFVLR